MESKNFKRFDTERYKDAVEKLNDKAFDFVYAQQKMAEHGQPCDKDYILSIGKDYKAAIVEACNKFIGSAGIVPPTIKNETKQRYLSLYEDTREAVNILYSVYTNPDMILKEDSEDGLQHIDTEAIKKRIEPNYYNIIEADKLNGLVAATQKMIEGKADFIKFCKDNNLPDPFNGGVVFRNEYGGGTLLAPDFFHFVNGAPTTDNDNAITDWLCMIYKVYVCHPEKK